MLTSQFPVPKASLCAYYERLYEPKEMKWMVDSSDILKKNKSLYLIWLYQEKSV